VLSGLRDLDRATVIALLALFVAVLQLFNDLNSNPSMSEADAQRIVE
jgi:beta-lactamase regulating signal transducer with metallopeptidase domain